MPSDVEAVLVGGLACPLDCGFSDTKEVPIVAITHLEFDRRNPLAREIEADCKHRVKRLEKLYGGMASTRRIRSFVQPMAASDTAAFG